MFRMTLQPLKEYVDKAKRTYDEIKKFTYDGLNWDGEQISVDGWRLVLRRDGRRFQDRIFKTKADAKQYGDDWKGRTDE